MNGNLVVRRLEPLNCETQISELVGAVMPTDHFYIRNHFSVPTLDPATWRLLVGGLVKRLLVPSLPDLNNMRAKSTMATLECAGNGRSSLHPVVEGEQWELGAVNTAEWTGVPLAEVLRRAGVDHRAVEVVFRVADGAGAERSGPCARCGCVP